MMSPAEQKQASSTFTSSSYQLPLGASITKNKLKRELSNASNNSAGRNDLNKFQLESSKDWIEEYKSDHIDLANYNQMRMFSSMSLEDDLNKNNNTIIEQNNDRIKSTDKESATPNDETRTKDIAEIKNMTIPPSKDWIGKYKSTHVELKDYNVNLFNSEDKNKSSNETGVNTSQKMNSILMTAAAKHATPKSAENKTLKSLEAEFYSTFASSSDSKKDSTPEEATNENEISDIRASEKINSNDRTNSKWVDHYSSSKNPFTSFLPTSGGNSNADVAAVMKAMMKNNKKSVIMNDSAILKKSSDSNLQIEDIPSTNDLIQTILQPMSSSSSITPGDNALSQLPINPKDDAGRILKSGNSSSQKFGSVSLRADSVASLGTDSVFGSFLPSLGRADSVTSILSDIKMMKSQDDQVLTLGGDTSSQLQINPKDDAGRILKSGNSSSQKFGSVSLRADSVASLGTDSVFGSFLPSLGRADSVTSILSDIKPFAVPSSTDSLMSFKMTPSMDADMKDILQIPMSSCSKATDRQSSSSTTAIKADQALTTAALIAATKTIPPVGEKKPTLAPSLEKKSPEEQGKENSPLDLSEIQSMVSTIEKLAEKNKQEEAKKRYKKKEEAQKKTAKRTISKRNREPVVKTYVERPTNEDVLLGRGGKSNNHPGNIAYRNHVGEAREIYRASEKNEKTDQAQLLVNWVTSKGGRFLKRDPTAGNKWYIVTNLVARRKASQALREHMTMEERRLAKTKVNQQN